MDYDFINEVVNQMDNIQEEHFVIRPEMAVVRTGNMIFHQVKAKNPPFIINDYRMGYLHKGWIRAEFNLMERKVEEGMITVLLPGTIVDPIEISDDLEVRGMMLFDSFPMPFSADKMPAAFSGQRRDFSIMATPDEREMCRMLFDTLWLAVHQQPADPDMINALVKTIMCHFDGIYMRGQGLQQGGTTTANNLFGRFFRLVNLFGKKEHRLAFYADKLCVTPRYLGTVVHEESGTTAKEWIDRATIAEAKVMLRHDNTPVSLIADELNFANVSFFCKYFKRLTGLTPQQFRNGKG